MEVQQVIYIQDDILNKWLKEDVPYFDLTTFSLGISEQLGVMEYFTREDAVLCGSEEVARMATMLNLQVMEQFPSGTLIKAGQSFMKITGNAASLHMLWKVAQNIFDYSSGIATRTRNFVDKAHVVNPQISVVTTRKAMPGTKELTIKAVLAGGGMPHRLGLSETILIFKQHRNFFSTTDELAAKILELKSFACEKKILIEVESEQEAIQFSKMAVDGLQYDKFSAEQLAAVIPQIKAINSQLIHLAAGGINQANVQEYAATGVDAIVTTSVYFGKPIDIGVKLYNR
jgi:molybdenum transport protein